MDVVIFVHPDNKKDHLDIAAVSVSLGPLPTPILPTVLIVSTNAAVPHPPLYCSVLGMSVPSVGRAAVSRLFSKDFLDKSHAGRANGRARGRGRESGRGGGPGLHGLFSSTEGGGLGGRDRLGVAGRAGRAEPKGLEETAQADTDEAHSDHRDSTGATRVAGHAATSTPATGAWQSALQRSLVGVALGVRCISFGVARFPAMLMHAVFVCTVVLIFVPFYLAMWRDAYSAGPGFLPARAAALAEPPRSMALLHTPVQSTVVGTSPDPVAQPGSGWQEGQSAPGGESPGRAGVPSRASLMRRTNRQHYDIGVLSRAVHAISGTPAQAEFPHLAGYETAHSAQGMLGIESASCASISVNAVFMPVLAVFSFLSLALGTHGVLGAVALVVGNGTLGLICSVGYSEPLGAMLVAGFVLGGVHMLLLCVMQGESTVRRARWVLCPVGSFLPARLSSTPCPLSRADVGATGVSRASPSC